MKIQYEILLILKEFADSQQNLSEDSLLAIAKKIEHTELMFSINELPRSRETGRKHAEEEIDKLNDLCYKLMMHIRSMHRTSLSLIEKHQSKSMHPLMMHDVLRDAYVGGLKARSANMDHIPERSPSGRRKKQKAAAVATSAAQAYEIITGRRLTTSKRDGKAGGQGHEFLTRVLAALGVDASAEYLIDSMEKKSFSKR